MRTPTHRAWRKVRAWVKARERYDRSLAKDGSLWTAAARQESANTLQAVLIVMDAEMRAARRKQR